MESPFPNTRWSLVIEAQRGADAPAAERALDELCRTYWFPLYQFARRSGLSAPDAEDRTQGFFAILLTRGSFNDLDPEKGRMRSFMLTAMKRFLTNEWRKSQSLKRGGGQSILSIDSDDAEQRHAREPIDPKATPDAAFELSWARTLLAEVYAKLEAYYTGSEQQQPFEKLRPFLTWGGDDQPYAEVAQQLGMSEGSVRTAVHRMRNRYRELLESEIRDTVATPADAADELAYLKRVLSAR